MFRIPSRRSNFRKIPGPSIAVPLLAVLTTILIVNTIPVAHAENVGYSVTLSPNGGHGTSDNMISFMVHVGGQVAIPIYEGIPPEGMVSAGWSYVDGRADGRYFQSDQTLGYSDGLVFLASSEMELRIQGNDSLHYAVRILSLVPQSNREVFAEALYNPGDDITLDPRLPFN